MTVRHIIVPLRTASGIMYIIFYDHVKTNLVKAQISHGYFYYNIHTIIIDKKYSRIVEKAVQS